MYCQALGPLMRAAAASSVFEKGCLDRSCLRPHALTSQEHGSTSAFGGQSKQLLKASRGACQGVVGTGPACPPARAGCRALMTAHLWRDIVAFTQPRSGGAYDSHHRTAGTAGRTR